MLFVLNINTSGIVVMGWQLVAENLCVNGGLIMIVGRFLIDK